MIGLRVIDGCYFYMKLCIKDNKLRVRNKSSEILMSGVYGKPRFYMDLNSMLYLPNELRDLGETFKINIT